MCRDGGMESIKEGNVGRRRRRRSSFVCLFVERRARPKTRRQRSHLDLLLPHREEERREVVRARARERERERERERGKREREERERKRERDGERDGEQDALLLSSKRRKESEKKKIGITPVDAIVDLNGDRGAIARKKKRQRAFPSPLPFLSFQTHRQLKQYPFFALGQFQRLRKPSSGSKKARRED